MKATGIILFILNSKQYSGAENVVIQIIKDLRKYGYQGIYVSRKGSIRKVLQEEKIKFCLLEKLSVRNINRLIEKIKPDLIHANDFRATCLVSCCKKNVPIISHLHNNAPWMRKINLRSIVYGLSTLRCKKIITVSQSIEQEYIFARLVKKKIICVSNPVNIKQIRQNIKRETDPVYDIVFLGRLCPQKRPLFVIELISQIQKTHPVRCVMIGDGGLRTRCEKEIKHKGLGQVVEMTGFQKNPYSYLAKGKIMLMPSGWEGYGLAAIEGLAFGMPVLAAPVGGLTGIVTDKCGKLCATKEEYVEELLKLLENETYYQHKHQNALKRAESLDNSSEYHMALRKIYDEVLNGGH